MITIKCNNITDWHNLKNTTESCGWMRLKRKNFYNHWICHSCLEHHDEKYRKRTEAEIEEYYKNAGDLISWWCYETDFGRDGMAYVTSDSNEYHLDTADKLYDFLIGDNNVK